MLPATKECARCHMELPRTEAFYHRAGKWYQGACKSCVCARTRDWVKSHPEQHRANSLTSAARRRKANPTKYHEIDRACDLKRKYGITVEQYDAMFMAQAGRCKLCSRVDVDQKGRRLAVDYNHATGQIRGLLCASCNFAINRIETVPDWANKAREYLGVN